MENDNNNGPSKYCMDLSGKFLFMRHGETFYNSCKDISRRYNPKLSDSHLSDNGIRQAISKQEELNKLNVETVYVSPFYRAIQTISLALENYPNENLKVVVHPKIAEVVCGAHDYLIDIKQTKKDFNMNSKVKIDWSLFDEYVKNSKYDENFFYFENMNLVDEKEKDEEYKKLKILYDKEDKEGFNIELGKFLKEKNKTFTRYESLKHAHQRFEDFKEFLKIQHKDTINDKDKKVLCVCHSTFISVSISPVTFLIDKKHEKPTQLVKLNNCQIVTFLFD